MAVISFPSNKARPSRRSYDSDPVEEFDAPLWWACVLGCFAFYGFVGWLVWGVIT